MSGEQLGQARIRRNIERRHAQHAHLTTDDIVSAYGPQIAALHRPRRPMSSPD